MYFYVVHTLYCVLCCDVVAVGEREPLVLLGRNSHLALEIIMSAKSLELSTSKFRPSVELDFLLDFAIFFLTALYKIKSY